MEEVLPQTPSDPATFYREKVTEYLDKFEGTDRRSLIVIDGLDEAAGWRLDTSVLPVDPPAGVRIVISARQLAGDRGSDGWLRRLGWDSRRKAVLTYELPLLLVDGVRDVLYKMGFPVRELSEDVDIVKELFRLTERGDPLLLQLYASDLWNRGREAPPLRPQDLRQLKPGFANYFNNWFDLQSRAWRDAGQHLDEEQVKACLLVLSCALGPIKLKPFSAVLGRILPERSLISKQTLEPINRFVVGDGTDNGYAFAHPKLGIFVREEMFGQSESVERTREAYVEWGRSVVTDLNSAVLDVADAPDYALLYHIQHLEELQPSAPLSAYRDLVENGWRRAWIEHQEGLRGFARDLEVVWGRLREAAERDPDQLKQPRTGLGGLIRCGFCLSSIRSIGAAVPPNFMVELVRQSLITVKQALHFSRFKPDAERVKTLEALSPYLGDDLDEAITDARAIKSLDRQAIAIAALSAWTEEPRRSEMLAEASETAGRCVSASNQMGAQRRIMEFQHQSPGGATPSAPPLTNGFSKATAKLPQREPIPLSPAEIAQHLKTLDDLTVDGGATPRSPKGWERARVIGKLLPGLPPEAFGRGLEALKSLDHYTLRDTISEVVPRLTAEQLRRLANAFSDSLPDLDLILPYLPEPDRITTVANAYRIGFRIADGLALAAILTALALRLPQNEADQSIKRAQSLAKQITEDIERAFACLLVSVSRALSSAEQRALFEQAVSSTHKIRDDDGATILTSAMTLSPGATEAEQGAMADSVVRKLDPRNDDMNAICYFFLLLAPRLSDSKRKSLFEKLTKLKDLQKPDDDNIGLVFATLLPRLSNAEAASYLKQGIQHASGDAATYLITALSPHIAPEEAQRYVEKANAEATDVEERLVLSAFVVPYLSEATARKVLLGMLDLFAEASRAVPLAALSVMEGGWLEVLGIQPALGCGRKPRSCLETFGGPHAAMEVYTALCDVTDWWP